MSDDIEKRLTEMVKGIVNDLTLMASGKTPEDWDDYDDATNEYPLSVEDGAVVFATGGPHIELVWRAGCVMGRWYPHQVHQYPPTSVVEWAREVWGPEESS